MIYERPNKSPEPTPVTPSFPLSRLTVFGGAAQLLSLGHMSKRNQIRLFMLIPTVMLGSFIVSWFYGCWISFYLTQNGVQGTATITDARSHGVVGYSYTVGGVQYTGHSQRDSAQYPEVVIGGQAPVYICASHPSWSSLQPRGLLLVLCAANHFDSVVGVSDFLDDVVSRLYGVVVADLHFVLWPVHYTEDSQSIGIKCKAISLTTRRSQRDWRFQFCASDFRRSEATGCVAQLLDVRRLVI